MPETPGTIAITGVRGDDTTERIQTRNTVLIETHSFGVVPQFDRFGI